MYSVLTNLYFNFDLKRQMCHLRTKQTYSWHAYCTYVTVLFHIFTYHTLYHLPHCYTQLETSNVDLQLSNRCSFSQDIGITVYFYCNNSNIMHFACRYL